MVLRRPNVWSGLFPYLRAWEESYASHFKDLIQASL